MTGRVVAIDGPAASGKSSTAASVARALGASHLDSGALYRGLTQVALDLGTDDPAKVIRSAEVRGLCLVRDGLEIVPYLDGDPAEARIRTAAVTNAVSRIAAIGPLRDWVNLRLRREARDGHTLVLDGRDIGTAVFPDAEVKVFLTATPHARARRRLLQRGASIANDAVDAEARQLEARDAADAGRAVAPLRRAPDATLIDSTDLTLQQQVDAIVALARKVLPG
jgi:cytidylate kinase